MDNTFKTAEEIAIDWGISARYAQALCRQGKVEGAIKRAGAWFIPSVTMNPAKNTKSNAQLCFNGTKRLIFEKAVELFAERTFELVTIKDIAHKVGIRQSAMYNHFKSKQEILETIYEYFTFYYTANRPTIEDLEPVLREGSLFDIINAVEYEFEEKHCENMLRISRIVFQRRAIDEGAREISTSLILEDGIRFVEDVFKRAIEIGRLAPFDVHSMAVFCNSNRLYVMYWSMMEPSPESWNKLLGEQQALKRFAVEHLKDLKPLEISKLKRKALSM